MALSDSNPAAQLGLNLVNMDAAKQNSNLNCLQVLASPMPPILGLYLHKLTFL